MTALLRAAAPLAPAPGPAAASAGYRLTIRDPESGAMTIRVEQDAMGVRLDLEIIGLAGYAHRRPALPLPPGDWARLTAAAAGSGFWYAAPGGTPVGDRACWTLEGWRPGTRQRLVRRSPEGDAVAYLGALLRGLARAALAREASAAPAPVDPPRPWRVSSAGCS